MKLNDHYLGIPSEIIKILDTFELESYEAKEKILEKLKFLHLLKMNAKWKIVFKISENRYHVTMFLQRLLGLLITNSSDSNSLKAEVKTVKICEDQEILKIICEVISILQFDFFQHCTSWADYRIAKFYKEVQSSLKGICNKLVSNKEYIDQIKSSES